MIPTPPSGKPVAIYDTECYPNYWLLKLRPQGGEIFSFELRAGERLTPQTRRQIFRLFDLFTTVSFNGNNYDVSMVCAALNGFSTEELHSLNNQIIMAGKKPWDLGLPEWKPADHIDVREVLPGAGSQKMFAARIHYKTLRDLPYEPHEYLSPSQMAEVADYCENDLGQIEAEYLALAPALQLREDMGARYGLDLRSKSDAQVAEAVIKRRCEQALGTRLYKPEIDWGLRFKYEPPAFLAYATPQMQQAFEIVKTAVFCLDVNGRVVMPPQLEGLAISIGSSVYRMGIGGLHSSETRKVYRSSETHILRDNDVRGYYPRLILNSGKFPPALGPQFRVEFGGIVDERDVSKKLEQKFKDAGVDTRDRANAEAYKAASDNEGGKVMSNGSFGKTMSPYSILFAPQMGIQTTVTGQLSILMLIEWHELYGIPVVSANTDGFVAYVPRHLQPTSDALIKEWEKRTGLEMEGADYAALYSRDVNNYFAVKTDGKVKRKGAYAKAGLIEKKSPDVEICGDAVADFLSKGTPLLYTIAWSRDITKFVTVQKVSHGAVKLWGEGPRKGTKVVDMKPKLIASGWVKATKTTPLAGLQMMDTKVYTYLGLWVRNGQAASAATAYAICFPPQRPEYLGRTVRWYYGVTSPGPIVSKKSGNQVPLSYGAKPCMTLPDEFPSDIDYGWYLKTCEGMLKDIGYADVGGHEEPIEVLPQTHGSTYISFDN